MGLAISIFIICAAVLSLIIDNTRVRGKQIKTRIWQFRGRNFALQYTTACEEYKRLTSILRNDPYNITDTEFLKIRIDLPSYELYVEAPTPDRIADPIQNRAWTYAEYKAFADMYNQFLDKYCEGSSLEAYALQMGRAEVIRKGYMPDNSLVYVQLTDKKYSLRQSSFYPDAAWTIIHNLQSVPNPEIVQQLDTYSKTYLASPK